MAKELPEYKEARPVMEVGQPVTGFQQAYSTYAKGTSIVGEIGMQIAQKAANQLATIQGEEAARRNPNRMLMPTFTESDSHFVQAFEHQAYNDAIDANNQLLQKQYLTVLSQPLSAENIELFNKNWIQGAEGILQNVPHSLRNRLQSAFQSSKDKINFSLSKQLALKNQKELTENFTRQFNNGLRSMIEKQKLGFIDDATQERERLSKIIEEGENNRLLSKSDAEALRETVNLSYKTTPFVNNVTNKYLRSEQEAFDYIRDFWEHPEKNKDLMPTERTSIGKAMMDELHRNEIMTEGSKALNAIKLYNGIKDGSITEAELPMWHAKVGDKHFLHALSEYETGQKKLRHQRELAIQVFENNMEGKKTSFDDESDTHAAEQGLLDYMKESLPEGQELTLDDYRTAAQILNDPKCHFAKTVTNMALNGGVQEVQSAAAMIAQHDADPKNHYLDKVTGDARAIARSFNNESRAGMLPPEKILEKVRNDVLNAPKDAVAARIQNLKSKYRDWSDTNVIASKLASLTGWNKSDILNNANQAITNFKETALNEAPRYAIGQLETALEEAARKVMLKTNYTYVNGYKQLVDNPIEMNSDKPLPEIHKEVWNDLKEYSPKMMEAFEKGSELQAYEIEEKYSGYNYKEVPKVGSTMPLEFMLKGTPLYENGIRRGNKITKDPDTKQTIKVPGRFEIMSDEKSGFPDEGGNLSYGVIFIPDDTNLPERLPSIGNAVDYMRYSPISSLERMTPEQLQELRNKLNAKNKLAIGPDLLGKLMEHQRRVMAGENTPVYGLD